MALACPALRLPPSLGFAGSHCGQFRSPSLFCSFPGDLKDILNSYSTPPPVQTPWPSYIPGRQTYGSCQHLRSPPFPPPHNCPPSLSGPDPSTSTLTLPLRLSLQPSPCKAPRSILAPSALHSCRLPSRQPPRHLHQETARSTCCVEHRIRQPSCELGPALPPLQRGELRLGEVEWLSQVCPAGWWHSWVSNPGPSNSFLYNFLATALHCRTTLPVPLAPEAVRVSAF